MSTKGEFISLRITVFALFIVGTSFALSAIYSNQIIGWIFPEEDLQQIQGHLRQQPQHYRPDAVDDVIFYLEESPHRFLVEMLMTGDASAFISQGKSGDPVWVRVNKFRKQAIENGTESPPLTVVYLRTDTRTYKSPWLSGIVVRWFSFVAAILFFYSAYQYYQSKIRRK